MRELVELIFVPWIVMALVHAALYWDRRRLKPAQAAHAWPGVSLGSAIYLTFFGSILFGVLSVAVHVGRTRRTVVGILAGIGLAVLSYALVTAAIIAVDVVEYDGALLNED